MNYLISISHLYQKGHNTRKVYGFYLIPIHVSWITICIIFVTFVMHVIYFDIEFLSALKKPQDLDCDVYYTDQNILVCLRLRVWLQRDKSYYDNTKVCFLKVTQVTQVTYCYGFASVVVRIHLLIKNYWANRDEIWYFASIG